jgi:phthiocerol/phenolphthiocerol synthesis type-I polyketide synthase E
MKLQDAEHVRERLLGIWSKVLAIPPERIPPDRNFFTIGGDSILLMQMMDRVNSEFFAGSPEESLPLTDFFTFATLQELSNRLGQCGPLAREAIAGAVGSSTESNLHSGAIAIVGIAGRFPGASDAGAFWKNLREGVESLRFFSDADLLQGGATAEELADHRYVRCAGLIDDVQSFDAELFGVTEVEAALMAPEQRLLLECAQEAMDDAGYGVRWRGERVGVFAGFGLSTYLLDNLVTSSREFESATGMRVLLSNSSPATRISYLLNLTGPSITIDTACSSSLVALHQACRSILNGECEMALAGGATVRRVGCRGYRAEEGGIFSPDGHCRPFDRQAQGTVPSSGAGMVLLKRLTAALADRDSIYAVIRGTAINNDGSAKVGYTAPGLTGQAAVIRSACEAAGIDPADLQYIETHGTATALGDVIEIAALNSVVGANRQARRCALGTLKANVGHMEAAAGVAGLMKVALALKHREIPPAIHYRAPHPQIHLERTPFYLNRELERWTAACVPRRAGVSSFGIGGTNGHAVLEEAPAQASTRSHRDSQLLILSAQSPEALRASARRLAVRLAAEPQLQLADVAFTLQVGRAARPFRRYCVCESNADAVPLLEAEAGSSGRLESVAGDTPVVFMLPAAGAQYPNMMRGIYESEPVFRQHFEQCAHLLRRSREIDLRQVAYPKDLPDDGTRAKDVLGQPMVMQAALFASEYALARLWQSWGVVPSIMIGHGVGEYVAGCISGVLSLQDALYLVCAGGCASPRASREDPAIGHAAQSPLTGEALSELNATLDRVALSEVTIPFVSSLRGSIFARGTRVPAAYWLERMRHTGDLARGVQAVAQGSAKIFLEVGPGTGLSSWLRNVSGSNRHIIISSCRNADDCERDSSVLMHAAGKAWQAGATLRWPDFNASIAARRVALPTYPFERRRHWIDRNARSAMPGVANSRAGSKSAVHAAADDRAPPTPLANWFYVPTWKQRPVLRGDGAKTLGCCIFLDDGTAVGESIGQVLARRSREVVRVRAGECHGEDAAGFTLNPMQASDYATLIDVLLRRSKHIDSIVHAWRAGAPGQAGCADERELALGFHSLLHLCQAIDQRLHGRQLELIVVTDEAHVILGDERGSPHDAMLSACVRVICQELANVSCHSIDMSLSGSSAAQQLSKIDAAIGEALASPTEPVMACRGFTCFAPTYERLDPESTAASGSLLRAGGTYLITGGLGGIGLTLAEFLSRVNAARIVLTSRSEFLPREQWDDWLLAHGDDEVSRRIRKIRAIEARGTEVMLLPADVTEAEQMRSVVARTLERSGMLHGVIHAAGVPGGGVIALKSLATLQQVTAPKVRGTLVILDAVKDLKLDFFLACSSIAAILAPSGQFEYCAANAFQDAFAHVHDRRAHTRFISINWDGWSEEGMALNAAEAGGARPGRLDYGMSCAEGCEVFRRVMESPRPQWIISMRELTSLGNASTARRALSSARSAEAEGSSGSQQSSRASSLPDEEMLAAIWRDLLGVSEAGVDDDFFELGGDSLLAIDLSARLESQFGTSVSLRQLIQAPTIASLASLLRNESARLVTPSA